MLGMWNLLPFLKGWEYKTHTLSRNNVVRGADPIQKRVRESGWGIMIMNASTDCYGTLDVTWQGADLESQSLRTNAESARLLGAISQDPAGWVQRYLRPNPNSTAGVYVTVLSSAGYQGAAWPYVPTVILEISLPTTSTQSTATITATMQTIAITNKKLFLLSLRRLLEIKGKIDPALIELGTQLTVKDVAP